MYGHHFNSDTRTVLTLLLISGIEFDFEEVDIFLGQHKEVSYLTKNPCGLIPTMIDQENLLMGSVNVFANYLTATKPKLQTYAPREHLAKIEQHMNWHLSVLRPCI